LPSLAADSRIASITAMLATPSANVGGRGSAGTGVPAIRARSVSYMRVAGPISVPLDTIRS